MSTARQHQPSALPVPGPFGASVEHLDIDFDGPDRTQTAVCVVACLAEPVEDQPDRTEWAWSLPVSSRTLQLLRIVQATQAAAELTLRLPCPQTSCRESLELELPLPALVSHGHDALATGSELTWELAPSRAITVRRATGLDQQDWKQQRFADQTDANRTLLSSLVTRGETYLRDLDAAKQQELSEALREFDPLAAFQVTTECPVCGHEATHPVDLEQVCLDRLRSRQWETFQSIHRLAKTHGWSESEILGLSPQRLAAYLSLIDSEEVAG